MLTKSKILLVPLFTLLLGCNPQTTALKKTTPQQAMKANSEVPINLSNSTEANESAGLPLVRDWGSGTYYGQIVVSSKNVPSSIVSCSNEFGSLLDGFRRLSGINQANTFTVLGDISIDGRTVYTDLPLMLIARLDPSDSTPPTCRSFVLGGKIPINITPYYLISQARQLNITLKLGYANIKSYTILSNIIKVAKNISSIAGLSGSITTNLISEPAESFSNKLENQISTAFSIKANDNITLPLATKESVGTPRKDKVTINLGKLLPNSSLISATTTLSVELNYLPSMIGNYVKSSNGKRATYDPRPGVLLDTAQAVLRNPKTGDFDVLSMRQAIENNYIPAVSSHSLRNFKGTGDKFEMENTCYQLKTFFSSSGFSYEDSLVLRWAVVREFTNYTTDGGLRTPRCFTPTERDELTDLNTNFVFTERVSKEIKKEIFKYFTERVNGSTYQGFSQNYTFAVEGDSANSAPSNLLPSRKDGNRWSSDIRETAITHTRELFEGSKLCWSGPGGDKGHYMANLVLFAGIEAPLKFQTQYKHISGRRIVPIGIEFDPVSKEYTRITVAPPERFYSTLGTSLHWWREQKGGCERIRATTKS